MASYPQQMADGQYTAVIYGHIKDKKYDEVVRLLGVEQQNFPRSRAALSLLGHCYYMLQDFHNAVQMYEALIKIYTDVDGYKIYYAQSLCVRLAAAVVVGGVVHVCRGAR